LYHKQLLAFTAGGLIYMSVSQIFKEIHEYMHRRHSVTELFVSLNFMGAGILCMFYLAINE